MRALAVFHDHGGHILDRLLKPGFRHVFVVLLGDHCWTIVDACEGVPQIEPVAPKEFDMVKFYRDQGFTVVETEQRDLAPRSAFSVANCVGMAKAVLSVRSFALTPWQLHQYLRRNR